MFLFLVQHHLEFWKLFLNSSSKFVHSNEGGHITRSSTRNAHAFSVRIEQPSITHSILVERGSKYGYFFESAKSFIIVKLQNADKTEIVFTGFGVKVVTGHRYLGS